MPPDRSRVSLVAGLLLIGLGALFLLQQIFSFDVLGPLWPLLVLGAGGLIFSAALSGGPRTSALAIPASILTTLGLILLVLNLTDRWEAWSYSWALLMAAVGLGLVIHGRRSGQAGAVPGGLALMRLGLTLFLLFGAFFELIIFGSPETTRWGWPALLIVLGVYLLLRSSGVFGARRAAPAPPSEVTLEGAAAPAEPEQRTTDNG